MSHSVATSTSLDSGCLAAIPVTLFFIGTAGEVEIDDVGSLGAFLVSTAAQGVTGDIHSMDGSLHILA